MNGGCMPYHKDQEQYCCLCETSRWKRWKPAAQDGYSLLAHAAWARLNGIDYHRANGVDEGTPWVGQGGEVQVLQPDQLSLFADEPSP